MLGLGICRNNIVVQGGCMILSSEYDRLVVENSETGEEIAVITQDEVTTADDKIVVRLKPSED